MPRKVVVQYDSAGADAMFEIPHLGLFQNGVENEVSDEQIAAYEQFIGPLPQSGTIKFPEVNQKAAEAFDAEKRAAFREAVGAAETLERMAAANSETLETPPPVKTVKVANTKEGGDSA